jgi:hypothetical protein
MKPEYPQKTWISVRYNYKISCLLSLHRIFVSTFYCGVFIDLSLLLNRRRKDEDYNVIFRKVSIKVCTVNECSLFSIDDWHWVFFRFSELLCRFFEICYFVFSNYYMVFFFEILFHFFESLFRVFELIFRFFELIFCLKE